MLELKLGMGFGESGALYFGVVSLKRPLGPVRRIDEIGRVVIPAAIREALGWKPGDALEILADEQGKVVLKRHFPLSVGAGVLVVELLHELTGATVFLADTDEVVLARGASPPHVFPRFLSRALTTLEPYWESDGHSLGCPIIRSNEVIGALGLRATFVLEEKHELLLKFACEFLGRYSA